MSGMLVKTRHQPQLGSNVVFKIDLSDHRGTIFGRGELVRHATPGQGSVDGLGVKFLSFASDGAQKLQDYLDDLNTEPEPESDPAPATRSAPETPTKPKRKKEMGPEIIIEFE